MPRSVPRRSLMPPLRAPNPLPGRGQDHHRLPGRSPHQGSLHQLRQALDCCWVHHDRDDQDAAITSAKVASLDAAKITSGGAARIAASSITSDKLSIAAGYITTAMIKGTRQLPARKSGQSMLARSPPAP